MILGDLTRVPVTSLAGEYLEHMRKNNPRCFENSIEHLFNGKPTTGQPYDLKFGDKIGEQWLSATWMTGGWDARMPSSTKYIKLLGSNWTLSEVIQSGSIFTNNHDIQLTLTGRTFPETMISTLIGKPLSRIIDLPAPFLWTADLVIEKIANNPTGSESYVTLTIPDRAQPSLVKVFPDPEAEKAADRLVAQVQKLVRKMMKARSHTMATLADKAQINPALLKKAMNKGGDGPDLRMLGQIFWALGFEPEIRLKEITRRPNRR
jgi:DNA-binding phage protein